MVANILQVQGLGVSLLLLVLHVLARLGEIRLRDLHSALAQRKQPRLRADGLDVRAAELVFGLGGKRGGSLSLQSLSVWR